VDAAPRKQPGCYNGSMQRALRGCRHRRKAAYPEHRAARRAVQGLGQRQVLPPVPCHRPVDWDGALVSAIADVTAAQDSEAYGAAVERMLATLGDRATCVIRRKPADEDNPLPTSYLTDDHILVITASSYDARTARSRPAVTDRASPPSRVGRRDRGRRRRWWREPAGEQARRTPATRGSSPASPPCR
jgi:hypothetical protein